MQAIPQKSSLILNLKQDATLVLLALWYEFDTQVRDHGATEVRLSVEQLNQLLKEKLLPDLKSQPSAGRMREILSQARRFNLVEVEFDEPFEKSVIEVLPTLKKVIVRGSKNGTNGELPQSSPEANGSSWRKARYTIAANQTCHPCHQLVWLQ